MRKVNVFVCLLALAVATGCGASQSGSNNNSSGVPSLAGTWLVTAEQTGVQGGFYSEMNVTLVPSACSVSTPIGTFTVQGTSCYIADSNSGQGSITEASVPTSFLLPPQGVLIGIGPPIPTNNSPQVDFVFVEADTSGDVVVFNGNGTYGPQGNVFGFTGTWQTNANSTLGQGDAGSFSATQK